MRPVLVALLLLGSACEKRAPAPRGESTARAGDAAPPVAPVPAAKPIVGPHVDPVVTDSAITFGVPRTGWWVTASLACYNAIVGQNPGSGIGDMFGAKYPWLTPALAAAEINLQTDLVSFGAFACGKELCIYGALKLASPEKLGELVKAGGATAGGKVGSPGPAHYTLTLGEAAGRVMHFQLFPVDWSGATRIPLEPWAADARRATHLLVLYGVNPGDPEPDPLAALADGPTALARVREVEGLATDVRGRCLAGDGAPDETIPPGAKLTRIRVLAAGPPRPATDVTAAALGSSRSIGIEVMLEISPPPTDAQVKEWIAMARRFVKDAWAPYAPMAASMGELGEQVIKGLTVIADAGFRYELNGAQLRLSFQSARITEAQLRAAGM